ncbi:hypothetical protein N7468_004953 [Penicillium chermesinum]|uniref:Uncharacterized protein n=1 Tax=Penicillium chermesinum TaxID=63820 RepID=A0A9W9TMQ9_9EURO|nr:uncharacterized protein N7468_004953 [Penicillium chermesinum]KAJ5231997.1 hypothetical protein N7468_004953 [Penicillium chermesinum]
MPSDSDDDALFASLEEEDHAGYRTQRIQQLNAELASQKTNRDISNAGAGASLLSRDSTYVPSRTTRRCLTSLPRLRGDDDDDAKENESESDDGETRRRGGLPRRAIRSGNTALRGRGEDEDDDWD